MENERAGQHPCYQPDMTRGAMTYAMMYPEMHFIIQPYVIHACDEIEMYGFYLPSREMMACICDRVCADIMRDHPEMSYMDMDYPSDRMAQVSQFGFRSRGPFRDFILILLLSEFFRRRRY